MAKSSGPCELWKVAAICTPTRGSILEDLDRHAVVEPITEIHGVVGHVASGFGPGVAVTGLERMRSGDVGDIGEPRSQVLLDAGNPGCLRTNRISETARVSPVEEPGGLLEDRDELVRRCCVEVRLAFDLQARFDQETINRSSLSIPVSPG